jgi:hypothetical protein
MDKEKLLLWIGTNDEIIQEPNWCRDMVDSEDLIKAIRNGEFDKEPCDYCKVKFKDRTMWMVNNCSRCGRKLEESK